MPIAGDMRPAAASPLPGWYLHLACALGTHHKRQRRPRILLDGEVHTPVPPNSRRSRRYRAYERRLRGKKLHEKILHRIGAKRTYAPLWYNLKYVSLNSKPSPAQRIDTLLSQVADEYRNLPRYDHLALHFREALAHFNLAGGYARRGAVARPLSELIPHDVERNTDATQN